MFSISKIREFLVRRSERQMICIFRENNFICPNEWFSAVSVEKYYTHLLRSEASEPQNRYRLTDLWILFLLLVSTIIYHMSKCRNMINIFSCVVKIGEILFLYTMWRNEKFTLTNFSKTVTFTKFLPKMCESKFPQFSHCYGTKKQNFVKSTLSNLFSCTSFSRNFCQTSFF